MSEYLFIGGSRDGYRIDVEYRPMIEFVVRIPMSLLIDGKTPTNPTSIKREAYQSMRLAGQSERFTIYALNGMTGDDVMRALIENYR